MNPQIVRPIWLVAGSVVGATLIVSACSFFFNGKITADYLITGLIASMIVAPVTLGLLSRADRRALMLLQDRETALRKRVEEELILLREKDHLLIEQSRLASMGEMIGNIAHQWRQPLSMLGLTFQNMRLDYQSGTLDAQAMNHYVDDALNVVDTMSRTIDDLRYFFRPATKMVEFNMRDVISQGSSLISASLAHHDIALRIAEGCSGEGCNAWSRGYPNQFSQVLLNLLTNAKEALVERNVPGGRIEIACRCNRTQAVVTVSDNGGGISAELLPKIFDPYFTTKASGSGIGLYMSKMIMENMGGRIAARNGPDGAEFTLTLPVARNEEKP